MIPLPPLNLANSSGAAGGSASLGDTTISYSKGLNLSDPKTLGVIGLVAVLVVWVMGKKR